MEWLNYHHLLYYWMVVRTGSVAAASTELKLASPTISVQIRRLEEQLGEKLLRRSGRHVVPTEMGQVVYRYADEIFALGRELVDTARGRPTGRPMHVVIGVHDVIPKSIARWLIEPALKLSDPVRITCREGSLGTAPRGAFRPAGRRRAGRRADQPHREGPRLQSLAR